MSCFHIKARCWIEVVGNSVQKDFDAFGLMIGKSPKKVFVYSIWDCFPEEEKFYTASSREAAY
jgi:hypothetical protein